MITKINTAQNKNYQNRAPRSSDINFGTKYCFFVPNGLKQDLSQDVDTFRKTFFHNTFLGQVSHFIGDMISHAPNMPKKSANKLSGDFYVGTDASNLYIFTNEDAKCLKQLKTGKADGGAKSNFLLQALSEENIKAGRVAILNNDRAELLKIIENTIFKDFNINKKIVLSDEALAKPLWEGEKCNFATTDLWANPINNNYITRH